MGYLLFERLQCVQTVRVWMNIFHCFVFGIIAISTARVNYVYHQKITVVNATVNW